MEDVTLAAYARYGAPTEVRVSESLAIGGPDVVVIGGPCTIESREQMAAVTERLGPRLQMLRGGAFKPRTSPYAFQGLGEEGLRIMRDAADEQGLPIVTEVMAERQIPLVARYADVFQIGSRNMQNYELLKAVGQARKPVLLKRGLASTIHEFLLAAEYVMSHGNEQVILCERGIRSYDGYTRNVLDLGAVVALKGLTHLPVIVDPSHAAGRRELVPALARAAIAAGADGVIVECHPDPDRSVSDAQQALSLDTMAELIDSLEPIARAVGRRLAVESDRASTWLGSISERTIPEDPVVYC